MTKLNPVGILSIITIALLIGIGLYWGPIVWGLITHGALKI